MISTFTLRLLGRASLVLVAAAAMGCSADEQENDSTSVESAQSQADGVRSVDHILYGGVLGWTFASQIERQGSFCIRSYRIVSDTGRDLSPSYRFEVEPHKVSGQAGGSAGNIGITASVGASISVSVPGLGPITNASAGFSTTFSRSVGQSANPGEYAHVMFTIKTRDVVIDFSVAPITSGWSGCDDAAATTKRVTMRVPAEVGTESYASPSYAPKYGVPVLQSLDSWQWIQSAAAFGVSYESRSR